jgi:NAD(P)-dependent dehydrogenase (short-subunit alcohol dehydrogenase family)
VDDCEIGSRVLDGSVALVTGGGGGGGIGLATARAFAEAGASVIVADRDETRIGKAAAGLRSAGHNVTGVICDMTDAAQVTAMVERAVSTCARLDAAFNNAGINTDSVATLETSDDDFDCVMNINLRGVWHRMKAELRQMTAQGRGAIVNCSSIGGMVGAAGRSAYSASKHAVIGLTRSAALEYAAKGIRINAVCPGMINTPMAIEVTKNYDPEIVKAMVALEPIGASVSRKRSRQPWCGFAARARASWSVMPWRSMEVSSPDDPPGGLCGPLGIGQERNARSPHAAS